MKNRKMKIFLSVLGSLLTALAFFVLINFKHIQAFPKIISAFYSKEFCSCYFVTEGDEKFCHNFARQWVPIQKFDLDQKQKKVTVTGLWNTNSARYIGEHEGCILENP